MTCMPRPIVVVVFALVACCAVVLGGAAPAAPPSTTASTVSTASSAPASAPGPSPGTTSTSTHPSGLRCDACHTPGGWTPARFAHERTGFPLQGRHVDVACGACHRSAWTDPLPHSCAGCHVDPHMQEFGMMCGSCHGEQSWSPLFVVDAHRRTMFPLSGRHASLPCEQCHIEKRDRTFTRVALGCRDCHAADAAKASASTLSHSSLAPTCQSCHAPTSFSPARLPPHEACFPLPGTVHANIACATCHEPRALVGATLTGTCRSLVRCAECHTHAKRITDAQHKNVVGYAHASDKCAACHRAAR